MDNDKLIEEAASAIYAEDAAWGYVADYGQGEVGARWEDLGPRLREGFRERARAALAVFEKALGEATVTPTDDEREARAYSSPEAVAIAQRYLDRERRVEPQGEPSDAQAVARILASLDRVPDSDAVTLAKTDVRAALRAASKAGGEGR